MSQQQQQLDTDGISYSESTHTAHTGGSSTYMLGQAPAYINPPSFEEFTKRSRAYSRDRLNEDFQQDGSMKMALGSHHTLPQSNSRQQFEHDSEEDVSIDKPSLSSTPLSDSRRHSSWRVKCPGNSNRNLCMTRKLTQMH